MDFARWLHVLGSTVWVGGMFFAYFALRPSAVEVLEPPARLRLWLATLRRFFQWVWLSVGLVLASGLHMLVTMGGAASPLHARIMLVIGIMMMLVFAHVFYAPFGRLSRAVAAEDWPAAGKALGEIRKLVGINLALGLVTIFVATAGRALLA